MTSSSALVEALANRSDDPAPKRPLRADAARTRAALLKAARRVFERDGYVDAKIATIAQEAGVAHGSFYSHFDGKHDILAAVLAEASEEQVLSQAPDVSRSVESLHEMIEAANRAYLEHYRRNVKLMALMEQVAAVDAAFRALRLKRTDAFVVRNARLIRRLQREGHADAKLDPQLTAMALSAMVSRSAYFAFALGQKVDFESLVDTVTRLWINGIRAPSGAQLSTGEE